MRVFSDKKIKAARNFPGAASRRQSGKVFFTMRFAISALLVKMCFGVSADTTKHEFLKMIPLNMPRAKAEGIQIMPQPCTGATLSAGAALAVAAISIAGFWFGMSAGIMPFTKALALASSVTRSM